jgi:hypothetical protein
MGYIRFSSEYEKNNKIEDPTQTINESKKCNKA